MRPASIAGLAVALLAPWIETRAREVLGGVPESDMGILLTFMFLGNMCAALALVPALSRFLLARGGSRP